MHSAASRAFSRLCFGIGTAFASGAPPVLTATKPPAAIILSKADLSTIRSLRTLYCHIYEVKAGQPDSQVGLGYLKFRTFQDLAAVGNMIGFLERAEFQ